MPGGCEAMASRIACVSGSEKGAGPRYVSLLVVPEEPGHCGPHCQP